MRRLSIHLVVIVSMTALTVAEAPAQQPDSVATQVHVVGPGDTLWELARRYLSDPYLWPEIFSVNREVVSDPHWIYPEERLRIPISGAGPIARDLTRIPASRSRTVFFDSEASGSASDGSVLLPSRADDLAVVQPGAFYAAGMLVPDSLMVPLGRLEEVLSPTALPRRADPQIQPFDRVFMSIAGAVAPGMRLHLMRRGREIEPYGRVFVPTGTALVLAVDGGTATLEIETMYDQVAVGDLALPMPEFQVPAGARPVPAVGLEGVLLAFEATQTVASREDRAFVNLGRSSGVSVGDEFVTYLPATRADWGERPAIDVARVQVLRVGPLTSSVRVVTMDQPALEAGMPVRLVARMPE